MKVLESSRLYLRVFTLDDVSTMSAIHNDEETMRYIGRGGVLDIERTENNIDAFIKIQSESGFSIWALIEKECDQLIGHCGLKTLHDGSDVEIAYLIAREHWGKGYATEIAMATLKYGFKELGLKRIVALTFPENTASIKVVSKLGMKPEGERIYFGVRYLFFSVECDIS